MVRNLYETGCKIYMYEQVTTVYEAVKKFADKDLVGSEFIAQDIESGTIVKGIRHENAEALSFSNEQFDIVVSNDVYEHVNDVCKTFKEAYRVLKDGGRLIFSIPFHTNKENSERRAELRGKGLVNILEPMYHGNPMSADGSLVFHDFGWDILEQVKAQGFKTVHMITYYSIENGYLGGVPFVFEATK